MNDPAKRLKLFNRLSALPTPQLDQLIFALNPPPGNIPPSLAAPSQRVTALLAWAESPMGCSLGRLEQLLESVTSTVQTPYQVQDIIEPGNDIATDNYTGHTNTVAEGSNALGDQNHDLEKLESLLSVQNWKEADEQTKKILLENNQNKLLTSPKIRQLSLDLLESIDRLWMECSERRFGLRIQKQLWRKCLEPKKPRFNPFAKGELVTDSQAWNRFGCLVGWRGDDERYLPDAKLDFSIKAPLGCFPQTRRWLNGGYGNDVKQFIALIERFAQLQ